MARINHSYFVVMCDFKSGMEAIVRPEDTRRQIVEWIAEGQYEHIVFIHRVDGMIVEDVTDELVDEAEESLRQAAAE